MAVFLCDSKADDFGHELLQHGSDKFPVACYDDHLKSHPVPWHWHDELELAFITKGIARVSVESETIYLTEGDGFFVNAGLYHCVYDQNSACQMHSIVFSPQFIGGKIDSIFWEKYLAPLLHDSGKQFIPFHQEIEIHQEILAELELAWQACQIEEDGYEFHTRTHLSNIILLLSNTNILVNKHGVPITHASNFYLDSMVHYIHEHCAQNITIRQIASSVNISKSSCLRYFKQYLNTTPIQYLKQIRIQKAVYLLSYTDLKIIDIALECGFQDCSHFSKSFKAEKGCSPIKYRLLLQNSSLT